MVNKKLSILGSIIFLSGSLYANTVPLNDINLNKIAHPPHRIKPNTPFTAPSGFSPAQIQRAYGLSLLPQQGAGQTIAIVDAYDNPNAEADLGVFSATFGLPSCTTANGCFKKIYAAGSQPPGDPGWGLEIALDIQWAHAAAPQAKILLVEASSASLGALLQAVQVAVQNGANVISMSWGAGEFSTEAQYDSYFNVPNVNFTAASGDNGTGIIWPSVSPYVIAVGGTSLQTDSTGNYINESAWAGSGGGLSKFIKMPAYQANFATQYNPNGMRGIPDVSMVADPNTGLSVYDTYGYNGWLVVGGTSASSPLWAGVIAVTNSASSTKLPSLNALLYDAATKSYSTNYHDIITGSNGSCGPVCTARPGYDYVTGIGTPQVQNLVKTITGGGGGTCTRANPTVTFFPNTIQTIQQNNSVTINFTVQNNDTSICAPSTFTFNQTVNSSLIKAALNTFSMQIPGGGSGSGYMIVKASNVAVIGATYNATVNIKDTLNRTTSFTSSVLIGNPFGKK